MQYQSQVENKCLMTIFEGTDQQKQIDLSPLKEIIERDGLTWLIKELSEIHFDYSEFLIAADQDSFMHSTKESLTQLHLIRLLLKAFSKINDLEDLKATKDLTETLNNKN